MSRLSWTAGCQCRCFDNSPPSTKQPKHGRGGSLASNLKSGCVKTASQHNGISTPQKRNQSTGNKGTNPMPIGTTMIDTHARSSRQQHRAPRQRSMTAQSEKLNRQLIVAAVELEKVCRKHGIKLATPSDALALAERLSPRGAKPGDVFPRDLVLAGRAFDRASAKCPAARAGRVELVVSAGGH